MMFSPLAPPPALAQESCAPPAQPTCASGPSRAAFYTNTLIHFMATTSFTKKTLGLESAEPAVTPPPANSDTGFAKKPKIGGSKSRKRDIPEGLWTKCPKCSTMVFDKELD